MNLFRLLFFINALLIFNLLLSQDCQIAIDYEEHSCASFTFFEENDLLVTWTINGVFNNTFHGMDFDPEEAEEIAEEIRAAASRARNMGNT